MESNSDRAYRRKQERRARQDARRANRASKATHISHVSHTPCKHTALWGPPSEWSNSCDLYFDYNAYIVHSTSFDCTCDKGNTPGYLMVEIGFY